ncbi:MAG: universal stress protein [Deltaproteobacteria bacterium]|nr:universal stress protein [Deltaproteobacteria bacterium]
MLVPTDFTDASIEAVKQAHELAKQFKSTVHLVHVINTKSEAAGFYQPHMSFNNIDKEYQAKASDYIKKFALKHLKGLKNLKTAVLKGEPYKQIIKYANDNTVDSIVIGTHGKTKVDRLIFGSTTERVMRKASCPVIIVPSK